MKVRNGFVSNSSSSSFIFLYTNNVKADDALEQTKKNIDKYFELNWLNGDEKAVQEMVDYIEKTKVKQKLLNQVPDTSIVYHAESAESDYGSEDEFKKVFQRLNTPYYYFDY
jgi:hypothetical protein